jgi:glycosyltransferase involved in cell wall biosynthesis
MFLSVIIPAYNEASTLPLILQKIADTPLPAGYQWDIILVDDCSTDATPEVIAQWEDSQILPFTSVRHTENHGKGRAIRTGLEHARGNYTIIQDADLEYEPADMVRLLQYALSHADCPVVYGSRILGQRLHRDGKITASPLFYWGGRLVTAAANLFYGLHLTDEPTCYKLFRTDLLRSLQLQCEGFEFCPEVTAKVARQGIPIPEIPISYHPRTLSEGKKINWRDGVEAIYTLFRYRW